MSLLWEQAPDPHTEFREEPTTAEQGLHTMKHMHMCINSVTVAQCTDTLGDIQNLLSIQRSVENSIAHTLSVHHV